MTLFSLLQKNAAAKYVRYSRSSVTKPFLTAIFGKYPRTPIARISRHVSAREVRRARLFRLRAWLRSALIVTVLVLVVLLGDQSFGMPR
jgi:uncharacterized protein (DUF2342 family)